MISRKRILRFAIVKMLRQDAWAEKYNPKNQFNVSQYDYTSCKEYLSALREKWQEYEDPECELEEYVNVNKYSNYDDYAYDVDVYRTRLEWRNELDPDNEFEVSPCDFENKEYYVNALKRAWKKEYDPYDEFKHNSNESDYSKTIDNKKNWMQKYDKNNAYKLDPSDYDCEEEYLDALRFCWQNKYDPSIKTNIDVDDCDTEEDYRNALILDWQDTYDPKHQFNGFNFDKFTTTDDYLVELNDRIDWINKCNPEGIFSKIDQFKYDNIFQYQHVLDLRKAWKNKYDPNNIHNEIDPCDYSSVEEYHKVLMDD